MAHSKKLKSLINNINWLFQSFEDHNFENISPLEIALFKEKLSNLHDAIGEISSDLNGSCENIKAIVNRNIIQPLEKEATTDVVNGNATEEKENEMEKITTEENTTEDEQSATSKASELIEKAQEIGDDFEEEKIEEDLIEVAETEVEIVEEIEASASPTPIESNNEEVDEVEELVKESTKKAKKSINDIIKSKKDAFEKTEAFTKQISKPKRDMREIIDLNKSFIFKGELFESNNDLYNQFIDEMNNTRSEDEAFNVIVNWTTDLNWETEDNKAYNLLLRAIEKRFLPII